MKLMRPVGLVCAALLVLSGCGLEAIPGVTCGPGNCTGCCQDGVCQAGTAWEACGSGGSTCGTCANHQSCLAQACAMDQNQFWILTPVSAVITPTNNGTSWDDFGGAEPDPIVLVGNEKTPELTNTLTPGWNVGFRLAAWELMSGVTIQMQDVDDLTGNDPITPAEIFQFTEAHFQQGSARIQNWGAVQSIDFALTRAQ